MGSGDLVAEQHYVDGWEVDEDSSWSERSRARLQDVGGGRAVLVITTTCRPDGDAPERHRTEIAHLSRKQLYRLAWRAWLAAVTS